MAWSDVVKRPPVFLTTNAQAPERLGMALTCIADWINQGFRLYVLDAGADPKLWDWLASCHLPTHWGRVDLEPLESVRVRHVLAKDIQRKLEEPWAFWTDDDVRPPRRDPDWCARAIEGAEGRCAGQPWGLVCLWLPEATESAWPPAWATRPIAEVGAAGGCRLVRDGVPAEFPEWAPTPTGRGYDGVLCDAVRRAGHAVGVFTDPRLRGTHMGQDCSAIHPAYAVPGQPLPGWETA